ncbi:response regulator [Ferruginibacter sp.]
MKYEIGVVDDHQLFSKSLCMMLESFPGFKVTIDVTSGDELQRRLSQIPQPPDIILLDVNMPGMGGIECAKWLAQNYPAIRVAALTINDTDIAVLSMIRAGCCAYLLKSAHPNELEKALLFIAQEGYYNAGGNINFKRLMDTEKYYSGITEREMEFLQHACSDFTYDQIAMMMQLSSRVIETCRNNLFQKLKVQSRTGLVLEGLRRGLINL